MAILTFIVAMTLLTSTKHAQAQFSGNTSCPWNEQLQADNTTQHVNSTGYPDTPYPNDLNCSWQISAPANSSVQIQIQDLAIESHTSCRFDSLTLYRGNNRSQDKLATLCGYRSYMLNAFDVTDVFIHFVTDFSVRRRGFSLAYTIGPLISEESNSPSNGSSPEPSPRPSPSPDECPQNMFLNATNDTQSILSPNYPFNYGNHRNCSWTIEAPPNMTLIISVNYTIERHSSCWWDSLEIFNGLDIYAPREENLCGSNTHYVMPATPLPVAFILFRTDRSVDDGRFVLNFTAGPWRLPDGQSRIDACFGSPPRLQAQSFPQFITSPGYPSSYDNYMYCTWFITAPPTNGTYLNITIWRLDVEYHPYCAYDSVRIFNGSTNVRDQRVENLCGHVAPSMPHQVNGLGFGALVEFQTDFSIINNGFRLSYQVSSGSAPESPCHGGTAVLEALNSSSFLSSPNFPTDYPHHSNCSWHIRAPTGYVYVIIEEFNVEDHPSCAYDFLDIYTGSLPVQAERLAQLCGRALRQRRYVSTSNEMLLHFRSDFSIAHAGFRISYRQVDRPYLACFGDILRVDATRVQDTITSPEFPSLFSEPIECRWLVTSTAQAIRLDFNEVRLQEGVNCSTTSFEVFDGSTDRHPRLLDGCGAIPMQVQTQSGVAFIRLRSNSLPPTIAFSLAFQSLDFVQDCNATVRNLMVTSSPITLTSPGYPSNYVNFLNCRWVLTSDDTYLALILDDVSIECCCDYLRIYNDTSFDGAFQQFCNSRTIYYTTHGIALEFFTDNIIRDRGFSLTVQSAPRQPPSECLQGGRQLLQAHPTEVRTITPVDYNLADFESAVPFVNCEWLIQSSQSVVVDIVDLENPNSTDCSRGYLDIILGSSSTSARLARVCGSDQSPLTFASYGGGDILLRYTNADRMARSSFNLTYQGGFTQQQLACSDVAYFEIPAASTPRTISDFGISNRNPSANASQSCRWFLGSASYSFQFHVETTNFQCGIDYLEIYHGFDDSTTPLATVCNQTGFELTHFTDKILVKHVSETPNDSTASFNLIYRRLDQHDIACDNKTVHLEATSIPQTIVSPGWPGRHRDFLDCRWNITSDSQFIRLDIRFIDLECGFDYLQYFGGQICSGARTVVTPSSTTSLLFHTDVSIQDPGFIVTFTSTDSPS